MSSQHGDLAQESRGVCVFGDGEEGQCIGGMKHGDRNLKLPGGSFPGELQEFCLSVSFSGSKC